MPSFKIIGFLVLEDKILKGFTIYGGGGHPCHVTFRSLFLRRLNVKFDFDWPSGFSRKDV